MEKNFNVSIIIPVYNAEDYIKETLESIEKQKFNDQIEVLLINDGSEDDSVNIIESFIKKNSRDNIYYTVYNDGENLGQGARRNLGIDLAQGETILFLDADDFLVENAIDIAYKRLKSNPDNDFVIFEWAYYYPETNQTIYVNKEKYNQKLALYQETCELLLACSTYFTVNKLYKKSFLRKHNIKFGEGYIYEDLEFYIKCALRALRAPVIPNILYKVRVHEKSTTKTNYDNFRHRDSFLSAIKNSSIILHEGTRGINSPYNVNKYFIYRALLYSEKRLPKSKKVRNNFIYNTMKIINDYSPNIHIPDGIIPLYHHAFKRDIIKNFEVNKMRKLFNLHKKGKINFYSHRIHRKLERRKKLKWKIENNFVLEPLVYNLRRQVHKRRNQKNKKREERLINKPLKPNTILMLGFDYNYQGNSKYLFNYLKNHFSSSNLKFVTFNKNIPEDYRVTPRSEEFFDLFYSSKCIISESWIPLPFKKKDNQIWIQLWHGTPFKKMLFDSNESQMLALNPNHRVRMKKDIARWDYLLSDSEIAQNIFTSSFDFPSNKILNFGYPRNEWLVKNSNNSDLIKNIKIKNNIPIDKKIILYTPTWRDYNYKRSESKKDKNYIANLQEVLKYLGTEYIIINKAHSMDSQPSWNTGHSQILTVNNSIDTQELILISNLIVTDYSSIFFDAIHINKPFYFLTKDLNKFNITRGLYNDIYRELSPLFAKNEKNLAEIIKKNTFSSINIPKKYKNDSINHSSSLITDFITHIFKND